MIATRIAACLIALALSGPAWAATTPAPRDAKAPPLIGWTEFKGKVTHIDRLNRVIQIREGNTDSLIEVPVTENVAIYKQGPQESQIGDLEDGDSVTLRNRQSS